MEMVKRKKQLITIILPNTNIVKLIKHSTMLIFENSYHIWHCNIARFGWFRMTTGSAQPGYCSALLR